MENEEKVEEVSEDLYAPFGNKEFKKEDYEEVKEETTEEVEENKTEESLETTDTQVSNENPINSMEKTDDNPDKPLINIEAKPEKSYDEQNEFDVNLMKAYIGNGYERIATKRFNVSGFFFGGLYLIYRKYYLLGFFYALIMTLISLSFSNNMIVLGIVCFIGFIINLIIGLNFNKKYLEKAYKNNKKIEEKNKIISDEQITNMCREAGGTSMFVTIIFMVFIFAIAYILVPELIKLINKENSLDLSDLFSFIKND